MDLNWAANRVLNVAIPLTLGPFLLFLAPALFFARFFISKVFGNRQNMHNKVVIVTGASSGIGENIAYEYSKRKARVILFARRQEKLEAVAERCKWEGATSADVVVGDVTNSSEADNLINTAVAKYGQLDVLVLNAGVGQAFYFGEAESVAALRPTVDINFWGAVHPTVAALPHLKKTHGRIVVLSSLAAIATMPRHSIYCATKTALVQFFDTLRSEVWKDGVGVTIVFPGAVASELTAGKVIEESGNMTLDTERRDLLLGPQPMVSTPQAAKQFVDAACRGKRYIFVPFWITTFLLFKIFASELFTWQLRYGLMPAGPGQPPRAKQQLDAIGGQNWLYHFPTRNHAEAKAALESKVGDQS